MIMDYLIAGDNCEFILYDARIERDCFFASKWTVLIYEPEAQLIGQFDAERDLADTWTVDHDSEMPWDRNDLDFYEPIVTSPPF